MTDLTKIIKRDGRVAAFDENKIIQAIRAVVSYKHEPERLTKIAITILKKGVNGEIPTVEQVQDVVEQVLMAAGHYEAAKAYILYRQKHQKVREVKEILGVKDDVGLTPNQLKVLENRFLRHDESGRVMETPGQLFRRVAKFISNQEKNPKQWEEKFYSIISRMEFVPAGCYFRGAGTKSAVLANCFVLPVEDNMTAIFDSVKWLALIQQAGGGCVAGDSQVITSYCGLEKINLLYQRLSQGRKAVKAAVNGWKIDVADLKINTLAFDKDSARMVKDRLMSVWRYQLPEDRVYRIKAEGGLEVTTSDWHPFFVWEKNRVIEKRADELQKGDQLIASNQTVDNSWLFAEYQKIDGWKVDEKIGWLAGYILGDGSFGKVKANLKHLKYYQRLRMFDGRKDNLIKAQTIIKELIGKEIKIQKDSRCQTYVLTVVSQKLVDWLQKLSGINGPKDNQLAIKPLLIKSPKSVVAALLAGLLDSDGCVAGNRQRVSFDTESGVLAEQVASLLSIFGIRTRVREKQAQKTHWHKMYEVAIDGAVQLEYLNVFLGRFLTDQEKKQKLLKHINKKSVYVDQKSDLSFAELKPFLIKAGVAVNKTVIHRGKVAIGKERFWLQRLKWGSHISRAQMIKVLQALLKLKAFSLKERNKLKFWLLIHQSFKRVVGVVKGVGQTDFYDFTTAKYNNYLSGRFGLAVVHNTGFNFSKLRPKGDYVKSSGGFATGPVSFMKVFDAATGQVMQGGYRMGANMGILDVDHPDIGEFIICKTEEGEIANFNISVGATDEFMRAVKENKSFKLRNPRNKEVVQIVKARQLFSQMVNLAWRTGDPGMIFLDTINKHNPVLKTLGPLKATNPCGEQPLHPFDVCNLGSINLAKFVSQDRVDWDRLKTVTRIATRFLDNGVDASRYPLEQVAKMAQANRRIGLGVMGFADMLYQLGVGYNTDEGVVLAEKIMKFINRAAVEESAALAKEKGVFANWQGSDYEKKGVRRRNLAVTTIAPTGTISMVADCSSGIEPNFALSYVKNVIDEQGLSYVNPYFKQAVEVSNLSNEQKIDVYRRVADTGRCVDIEYLSQKIKQVFVTAYDIVPEWHVKMQAAFQKYTENAVSKTINFPASATMTDVEKAYMLAWELKCKGITIYRSGSKEAQVLSTQPKKSKQLIQSKIRIKPLKDRCPECGQLMEMVEGCATCRKCGFSKCTL